MLAKLYKGYRVWADRRLGVDPALENLDPEEQAWWEEARKVEVRRQLPVAILLAVGSVGAPWVAKLFDPAGFHLGAFLVSLALGTAVLLVLGPLYISHGVSERKGVLIWEHRLRVALLNELQAPDLPIPQPQPPPPGVSNVITSPD